MPIFKAPNNDTFRRDREDQTEGLPEGCVLITEQEYQAIVVARVAAADPPTKAQRIAAKLQAVGYTQEWMLDRDLAYALTFAQLGGVTEPQLYAGNATYHLAKDLKAELDAIRAEP